MTTTAMRPTGVEHTEPCGCVHKQYTNGGDYNTYAEEWRLSEICETHRPAVGE